MAVTPPTRYAHPPVRRVQLILIFGGALSGDDTARRRLESTWSERYPVTDAAEPRSSGDAFGSIIPARRDATMTTTIRITPRLLSVDWSFNGVESGYPYPGFDRLATELVDAHSEVEEAFTDRPGVADPATVQSVSLTYENDLGDADPLAILVGVATDGGRSLVGERSPATGKSLVVSISEQEPLSDGSRFVSTSVSALPGVQSTRLTLTASASRTRASARYLDLLERCHESLVSRFEDVATPDMRRSWGHE